MNALTTLTDQEKVDWLEIEDMHEHLKLLSNQLDTKRKMFWGNISLRTNEFGCMRIDTDTGEIFIHEDTSEIPDRLKQKLFEMFIKGRLGLDDDNDE